LGQRPVPLLGRLTTRQSHCKNNVADTHRLARFCTKLKWYKATPYLEAAIIQQHDAANRPPLPSISSNQFSLHCKLPVVDGSTGRVGRVFFKMRSTWLAHLAQ